VTSLYGSDADMGRLMYGQNARHVPAWMYVQRHADSTVGLVGASRVPEGTPHPLLYGSGRAHTFVVGEIIVRPHIVIATDALAGYGAGSLYLGDHPFGEMLGDGELIIGSDAALERIRKQWEG
jgi:hypothetical protein